jgi:(p)ppGpp synthase/HD superfamily hydrolase
MMPDHTEAPVLGERFKAALTLAADLHHFHARKSTTVPYLSHLLSVAALVLEDGGDEDEAIAALLHDALEDCADQISAAEIEQSFGPRVRGLVEACTDTPPDFAGGSKPGWKERKERYLDSVTNGHGNRISLADKLHNARSILRDHRASPDTIWDRFSAEKEETLWYYRELVKAYRAGGASGFLVDELEHVVRKLEKRDGRISAGETGQD